MRPALLVGVGEVVAAVEGVGVVGAQLRLPLLQRRFEQLDSLVDGAGRLVHDGEAVAAVEGVGMVGAQLRLPLLQRSFVEP
jgi:hypothetical protein